MADSKMSIVLTIVGSIVLPLAITTLSLASNYGGMQETLNITAQQTTSILKQQTELTNSIGELKQLDAIKNLKLEDMNRRLTDAMALSDLSLRDFKSEQQNNVMQLIRMREEDRKVLQLTQKEVNDINVKIARLTK